MFRMGFFFSLSIATAVAAPVLPVFNIQNAPLEVEAEAGTASIPVSQFFAAEEIDEEIVRFVATYDDGTGIVTQNLDMALFSQRTPGTHTNFLNYVADGDYVDSFIHRSEPNFVIQGGGFKFVPDPTDPTVTNVAAVPTDPPIANEPGISNTTGTISMAKLGGDPDSATSQWFVSTNANSANLDFQNGGFTVFARLTKETLANALLFNDAQVFPPLDFSASLGGPFGATPIHQSATNPVSVSKFIRFESVSLVPLPAGQAGEDTALAHAISSQPSSSLATASIDGENLQITPQAPGTGQLAITATDSVGNEVIGEISFEIGTSYGFWRNANFDSSDALDDAISGPDADPDGNGVTNLQAFAQGLGLAETAPVGTAAGGGNFRLTFLEQTDRLGVQIRFERSNTLDGDWVAVTPTPVTRDPTGKPNQERVTVTLPKDGNKGFYRVVFELVP